MRDFDGTMVDLNLRYWCTAMKIIKSQKLVVFWLLTVSMISILCLLLSCQSLFSNQITFIESRN